jgi:arylsulfatase A-like enzyme
MKSPVKLVLLGVLLVGLLGATAKNLFNSSGVKVAGGSRITPKNVVLIIWDDWGIDQTPSYDAETGASATAITTNFDARAATGVRYLYHNTNPNCSPTRSSMLTGLYPRNSGVGNAIGAITPAGLDESVRTVLDVLNDHDYRTISVGKHHLADLADHGTAESAHANAIGFDHREGTTSGAIADYTAFTWCDDDDVCSAETGDATTFTSDRAQALIPANGPFFMWVAFNSPHSPLYCPDDALTPTYNATCDPIGGETANRALYHAMIEAVDLETENLVDAIDLNTTTVCIMGDNGTPGTVTPDVIQGYANTKGKRTTYLGGVRTPMICFGDQVTDTGTSDALINASDWAATILELAGIPTSDFPEAVDSVSFFDTFADNTATTLRTMSYSEHFTPNSLPTAPSTDWSRSAQNSQYHLVLLSTGVYELYDFVADPFEATDLNDGSLTAGETAAYNSLRNKILFP